MKPTPARGVATFAARLAALALLASCGGSGGPENDAAVATADERKSALAISGPERSRWSAPVALPLLPVSAANLPDGRVLLWSAEDRFGFGTDLARTYTALLNPVNGQVSERLVTETGHDMFCPGTSNLPDGRVLVSGGLSSGKTSIYDAAGNSWSSAAPMNIPRAYHANTVLADGSVLALGGSWAGGVGGKHGEVWTEATGWRQLPGVLVDTMVSNDPSSAFGGDSHFWLLPSGNGRVLYAGPGVEMQWIDTSGDGGVQSAGERGDDEFSVNGNAVMFDAGRILKTGGGPAYGGVQANGNSYLIDTRSGAATVRRLSDMSYRRVFHNSVVLPNGQVVIVGGATAAAGFTDDNAVLVPELFDPATESFTTMPAMAVPRTYHGVALLLPDARVLVTGSGLCGAGCAANHPDYQILSPYYLYNGDGSAATRPVITAAPATAGYGASMAVSTGSPVAAFALVRLSSSTHAVNNDQRRLSLTFRSTGTNSYAVDVPRNPGWAVPGQYMLFALSANGTPSVARTVRIGSNGGPVLVAPDDQVGTVGSAAALDLQATGSSLTYSASGLPDGLSINAATGRVRGTPTRPGRYLVDVAVSNGTLAMAWHFVWTVGEGGNARFVRLESVNAVGGGPWASMAEFNLLDDTGRVLPRAGWQVSASSAETAGEAAHATNAIDGKASTIWHSQWQGATPAHPHRFTVDMGGLQRVGGFRYLPRPGGGNGTLLGWRLWFSTDGVNWGTPVAQGDFGTLGAAGAEKTVYIGNLARSGVATQSSSYSASTVAAKGNDGNTDGNFANGSVTHTLLEATPWWQVDLGGTYTLHAVRLWNRSDCCGGRLANPHVLVSAAPMTGRTLAQLLADPAVRKVQVAGTAARLTTVALATSGRYVRVQLPGSDYLQLAEVEVFGRPGGNRAPVLEAPGPQTAQQGQATTLLPRATDVDGDPLTWSASGLPAGLALDVNSGRIAGTPLTSGSYGVQLGVSDGRGGSAGASFTWTVQAPPVVIGPIATTAVQQGANASYTANASGTALTYSWDWGDGTPASAFSTGATATHAYAAAGIYAVTLSVRESNGDITTQRFLQAVLASAASGRAPASSTLAHEVRSGASARLWVLNADNDSVSVFDLATNARVAEVAVGAQPRALALAANGRVWVVNKDGASLSLISTTTLAVVQTVALPVGSQPYGVVVAPDGSAFVALEATGRVLKLSSAGAVSRDVPVAGARHLALSRDGTRLLVSRFVTAPQPGEATASVQTASGGVLTGGEVVELDPATLAQRRRFVLRHGEGPDSTIAGRGVPNYLGAAAIAPDGRAAWVPSKQDNIQRGALRDGRGLDFQTSVRAISSRLDLVAQAEDFAGRVDHDNAGFASAAAYHPNGAYLFVALETSREVAVLDAQGRRELFRIEAGRAPQGLAVAADGRRLYVHNFMDRTVGSYDLAPLLDNGQTDLAPPVVLSAVGNERLSAQVLRGKQFFYDARDTRLARDGYISCAACHNDGGRDGRTWDLTGFGEGLRNTIALRGRAGMGHGRLHWSANFNEVQDFEAQIRDWAGGTGLMSDAQFEAGTRRQPLGDGKAGVSADLDALAAYVASLNAFDATPWRAADGTLTAQAVNGRAIFAGRCVACHGGTAFSDSAGNVLRNVGTLKASSGKRLNAPLTGLDTPTLRDAWNSGPYLHDGSAATLEDAIRAHTTLAIAAADVDPLAAFVRQIGNREGAVAPATGLRGDYHANTSLAGTPVLVRNEVVDFDWGSAAPAAGLPADGFSVRWSGTLTATTGGSYRFQTVSDDGVRVWINNVLVIDNWSLHGATTDTSDNVALNAGQRVSIRVEYFENSGGAEMRLRWRLPGSSSYVAIPAAQLSPY